MVKLSKKAIKQLKALAKETGYVDTDMVSGTNSKDIDIDQVKADLNSAYGYAINKVQLSSLYGSTVREPDKYLGGTTYEEL